MKSESFKRNQRLEWVFNKIATSYDTIGSNYFSYFGKRLVEYLEVNEGANLLDVACGRGASLIPASLKVGEMGQAIGIDFSEEMIKAAQLLINGNKIDNIKLMQMDAEKLDYCDNNFDYILCGLAVGFFSNSSLAIDEMYRVLKVGGKLGISTWKKREERGVLEKVYTKLFEQSKHTNLNNTPGRPDFGTVEGIENILAGAGFENIDIILEKKTFYYKDIEEWWQEQWTNASCGLLEHIEKIGGGALDKFKEEVFIEIMKYKEDSGIRFDADIFYTFAQK